MFGADKGTGVDYDGRAFRRGREGGCGYLIDAAFQFSAAVGRIGISPATQIQVALARGLTAADQPNPLSPPSAARNRCPWD